MLRLAALETTRSWEGIIMIRPWYRSRLFWLGLPGLVFLVWVMVTHKPTPSRIVWMPVGFALSIDIWGDRVELKYTRNLGPFPFVSATGASLFSTVGASSVQQDFSRAIVWETADSPKTAGSRWRWWSVSLADWLLVLIYLLAWISLLVAWQRWKRHRLSRDADAAESDL